LGRAEIQEAAPTSAQSDTADRLSRNNSVSSVTTIFASVISRVGVAVSNKEPLVCGLGFATKKGVVLG